MLTVQDIVNQAAQTIRVLRVRTNNPNLKIKTIAILTHGLTDYVNFGNHNIIAINDSVARVKNNGNPPDAFETAETFANGIDSILSSDGAVILYACLSGSIVDDNVWGQRTAAGRSARERDRDSAGEGSAGRAIKSYLNASGATRQVWAHRTTAHTVGNPVWRVFRGPNTSGSVANDLPFVEHEPVFSSWGRNHIAQQ